MSRTKRLTIFAKGNLDVRDTLHSFWLGDKLLWNGINTLLRERDYDLAIRIQHEPWCRSDALLAATGDIPAPFAGREMPLGAFPLSVQFSQAIFAAKADVYVLSIQPDLHFGLAHHKRDGFVFHPHKLDDWSPDDREWLRRDFRPGRFIGAEESMANLEEIVRRIRSNSEAPILIYNVSSVVPGETIHCYQGMDENLSTRIRRFNLALIELSRKTGISIIDVDRIVASRGSVSLKLDATHLNAAGCRAVAEEVLAVLEDYGCIAGPGLEQ